MTDIILVLGLLIGTIGTTLIWMACVRSYYELRQSVFRYRLWRVRDELVDSALAGSIEKTYAAVDLIHTSEAAIRFSKNFTIVKLLALPNPTKEEIAERSRKWDESIVRHSPEQAAFLNTKRHQIRDIAIWHTLIGSISGLAILLVMATVIFLFVLIYCFLVKGVIATFHSAQDLVAGPFVRNKRFALQQLADETHEDFDKQNALVCSV